MIYAIGDIHGENELLNRLLASIPRQPFEKLIFLGDYIDRGPDSPGVVASVLREKAQNPDKTILLWGNHEDMAAGAYGLPDAAGWVNQQKEIVEGTWLSNGGGYTRRQFDQVDNLSGEVPENFYMLTSHLEPWHRDEKTGVYFVHGGIPPGVTPEETCVPGRVAFDSMDLWNLLWFRPTSSPTQHLGRQIVCGHTPQTSTYHPLRLGDHLIIDTGCVYGGPLTCLGIDEGTGLCTIWQSWPNGAVTRRAL